MDEEIDPVSSPEAQENAYNTEDDEYTRLRAAAEMIRTERRKYNRLLESVIAGSDKTYNLEDLARLVGTLEAAYNHCLASLTADADTFCVYKHMSYALILAGEMDEPDVEPLYDILAVVSNGRLEACMSCKDDASK